MKKFLFLLFLMTTAACTAQDSLYKPAPDSQHKNGIPKGQIKRTFQERVSFVYRACSFPYGCLIMTGTGIVPGSDFTLQSADEISISIDPIGTLTNTVK